MPVTNFTEHTQPLSDEEQYHIVPSLIKVLKEKAYDKSHWLSSKNLIREVEGDYRQKTDKELWLKDYRLRAMINYIVVKQLLPVASSSNGYWVMATAEEFDTQIKSLNERANSIKSRAHALKTMMNEL